MHDRRNVFDRQSVKYAPMRMLPHLVSYFFKSWILGCLSYSLANSLIFYSTGYHEVLVGARPLHQQRLKRFAIRQVLERFYWNLEIRHRQKRRVSPGVIIAQEEHPEKIEPHSHSKVNRLVAQSDTLVQTIIVLSLFVLSGTLRCPDADKVHDPERERVLRFIS